MCNTLNKIFHKRYNRFITYSILLICIYGISYYSWATPWDDEPIHPVFYNALVADASSCIIGQLNISNHVLNEENTNCVISSPNPPIVEDVQYLPDVLWWGGPNENSMYYSSYYSTNVCNVVIVSAIHIWYEDQQEYLDNVQGICPNYQDASENTHFFVVLTNPNYVFMALLHELGHAAGLDHITNDEGNFMDDDGGYSMYPFQIIEIQNLFNKLN